MTDLEAVCFDLDGTLCVADQSDWEIHERIFDLVGVDPIFTPEDVRAVRPEDLPTADTDREYYENLYRAVVADVDDGCDYVDELARATVEVIDHTAVSFRGGAREALDHVREQYQIGLVTNGGWETQTTKLDALGIRETFDVIVCCDPNEGIEPKPDPTPFQRALAALDASPNSTLYVGDWHAGDVVGAHNAGLRSAWVPTEGTETDDPDPEPHHLLSSMSELSNVL